MEHQQAAWRDSDNHMGAPDDVLCFPRAMYNMSSAACSLGDISDTRT
jgi:hypothetical protein